MIQLQWTIGGFPLSNDRLVQFQTAWNEWKKLIPTLGDNVIIQGLELSGGVYSDGIVAISGEIYSVSGGSGSYIAPTTTTQNVTYADGTSNLFQTQTMYAVGASGTAISSFVRLSTLASLSTLVAGINTTVQTHTNQISTLSDNLASLGADVQLDQSHLMPKGAIIMWGGALPLGSSVQQLTLAGIKASIPYGFIPACVASFYNNSGANNVRDAWIAYVSELTNGNVSTIDVYTPYSAADGNTYVALNFPKVIKTVLGYSVNLENRFVIGAGCGKMTSTASNTTGGAPTHTLSINEMPAHTHSIYPSGSSASASAYVGKDNSGNPDGATDTNSDIQTGRNYARNARAAVCASTGGGQAFSMLPPYQALWYLIKII